MLRSALFTALAISLCTAAQAQWQGRVFVEDSSIKAYANNSQKVLAWCGGFNNPQFAMGDINGDGLKDLVIYEPWRANMTKAYINKGTIGNPNYNYSPYFSEPFNPPTPIVNDYMKLEDYNRDGVPDLVTRGLGGFSLYKGKIVNGRIEFTPYKELRYPAAAGGTINAYSQASDIPAVADVDGDGDLDFIGFNEDGAILYYFKNCQVEHGLPNDSVQVCKPTNCWGHVNQHVIREWALNIATNSGGCPTINNSNCKGLMHAGNTLCLLDMEGDGDMDLLDGNITFQDIQFLKNGRIEKGSGEDSLVSQDTLWQKNGVQVNMPIWPAAFHVDIDGDGRKDLLIAPHAWNISENYKCIAYYRNVGTTTVPNFVYQNDTMLVDRALDFGSKSHPVLYDYNKDGRLDLFVGTGGYYQSNGTFRSKIAYYQNTIVGTTTRFELQTLDFKGIWSETITGAYPAFGDLDNDGKDDLIVGHDDGTISFYKNNAISQTVQPIFGNGITLVDDVNATIMPTTNICPVIYDIDKDGKPDLLATGYTGNVFYYKNVSTASGMLMLKHISDTLGGMHGGMNYYSDATMYIGKMDNTGKDYIVFSNEEGQLRRYQGFESGNVTVPYQLIDTRYSGISVNDHGAVTFGDVDNDSKYEMFIGSSLGGLQQFKQVLTVNPNPNTVNNVTNTGVCSVYPNPAKDMVYLNWDRQFAANGDVNIRLVNLTGQTVARSTVDASKGAAMISVEALPVGIYVCVAQSGSNVYTQNVLLKK